VDPKMQTILSDDLKKQSESNLGILNSCLIPECGHKHLYTMIKKDIDGLHKDKLHRLAPSSFTVSLLFIKQNSYRNLLALFHRDYEEILSLEIIQPFHYFIFLISESILTYICHMSLG
jgi:hypothetical protein